MRSKIFWIVELDILEKDKIKIELFMKDVFEAAIMDEEGTLSNEWFITDDFAKCTMIDRYLDNDAVLSHLSIFDTKFNERFNNYFKLTRFVVYGEPDERVKKAVEGFNPIYMPHYAGFEK
ncbi:MAG TPA: hypothetical protein PL041_10415 [Melioribacteraceae bacterium]|nr:hypothetical protein [Melioribacteraceae bacterium]